MLYCSPEMVHVFMPLFPVLVLFPMLGLVSIVHSNVLFSWSCMLMDRVVVVMGMLFCVSGGFSLVNCGGLFISGSVMICSISVMFVSVVNVYVFVVVCVLPLVSVACMVQV